MISLSHICIDASAGLLQADLWRPSETFRGPAVVWNHGSRGRRRGLTEPKPPGMTAIEAWLSLGYAVFAPSRRGYDGSEGESVEVLDAVEYGTSAYYRAVQRRLLDELQDSKESAQYLAEQSWVRADHIVCSGYSFGGILTLLALGDSRVFSCGIAFATGAIMWKESSLIRLWLKESAARIQSPLLLLQANNDFSVEPLVELGRIAQNTHALSRGRLLPSCGQGPDDGHVVSALCAARWLPEVAQFLDAVVAARSTD